MQWSLRIKIYLKLKLLYIFFLLIFTKIKVLKIFIKTIKLFPINFQKNNVGYDIKILSWL